MVFMKVSEHHPRTFQSCRITTSRSGMNDIQPGHDSSGNISPVSMMKASLQSYDHHIRPISPSPR